MRRPLVLLLSLPPVIAACAPGGVSVAPPAPATEAEWQQLLRPRPTPLPGAPRVAIGDIFVSGGWDWASAAIQELVGVGLLRRPDVQFVERRRFAEAAERERQGLPRPPGAPPVGASPGAELILMGTLSPLMGPSARMNLRLVEAGTGVNRVGRSFVVPRNADPVALARRTAGALLAMLDTLRTATEQGRPAHPFPSWTNPIPTAAPAFWLESDVPPEAVDVFLMGVADEDAYDWEEARRAYQRARAFGGEAFFEPEVALARVARLRAGGTLRET